jgi:hypothetical protein
MGIVVKLLVAAGIAFGFHYAVQHGVATAIRAELGDQPQSPSLITIEPEALRNAMEVGRAVDTSAQRAVIDGASRQIEEMNRNMRPPLPPMPAMPPNIPGMPRH